MGRIRAEPAFTIPPDKSPSLTLVTAAGTQDLSAPAADHFALMLGVFAGEIRAPRGTAHLEEAWLGRMAVLDALRESARTKGVVPVAGPAHLA